MTVSISRMNINYYLSSVSVGDASTRKGKLTGYYTQSGDPAGTWYGAGLGGIGKTSDDLVTQADAISVYEELKHPATGNRLGHRPIETTTAPEGAKTPSGNDPKSKREAVAGFDLTFSAPKSVSALWAIADRGTQARIHTAHQNAVRDCLDWAEHNVVQTRAGHGGSVKVPAQGMIASLFDHFDSRAGDPQMHTHAVLANRVQRASDGKWVTLDSYTMHRWVVAISEMYNATLYDHLGADLGAIAEQRDPLDANSETKRQRRVELAGVPDELIIEFSTRSQAIESRTDELIQQWHSEHTGKIPESTILDFRRQATIETRDAKPEEKSPLMLRTNQWYDRARNLNLDPAEIVSAATGHHASVHSPDQITDAAVQEIGSHALTRTAAKHSTFTRANLVASAHRLMATVRFDSLDQRTDVVERIVDAAIDQSVTLTPDRYNLDHLTQAGLSLRGESVFNSSDAKILTTQETLDREATLMAAATDSTGAIPEDLDQVQDDLDAYRSTSGFALADDQKAAAAQVITDHHSLSAIIGPAGTGKTTTLAGLRQAWEAQNSSGSIIGLAPSAAAAAVLGEELDISTDNVAKWLYESAGEGAARRAERYQQLTVQIQELEQRQIDHPGDRDLRARLDAAQTRLSKTIAEQSKYAIKPGQLLIVDEASMSSTADIQQLHQQVHRAGGKLLLVGDPAQLDAVDAGGFLGWMEAEQHSAALTSVWRFTDKSWEPEASLRLRRGDPDVLDDYEANDRIHASSDGLNAAYSAWKSDQDHGRTSVLIAGRNDQVQALNDRAQAELVQSGRLDAEHSIPIREGRSAYLHDVVLARNNNRQLVDDSGAFIKNGTRLKLTDIHPDHVIATREDSGAAVSLPADYVKDWVELGYACTAHRAQGLTVDTAHVAADESFAREQLYVAMTRGKAGNHVYLTEPDTSETDSDTPDPWQMIRPIESDDPMDTLRSIVKKSSSEKTAHQVQDAEHGWAKDLARHTYDLEYLTDLSATRRAHQWIRARMGIDADQIADDPSTTAFVQAVKAADANPMDLPETIDSLKDATDHLRVQVLNAPPPQRLFPATEHANAQESEAQRQILAAIDQRVAQVFQQQNKSLWALESRGHYPDHLRDIAQWRAISDQEDPESVLGDPPSPDEKRLGTFHARITNILSTAQQVRTERIDSLLDYCDELLAEPEPTPNAASTHLDEPEDLDAVFAQLDDLDAEPSQQQPHPSDDSGPTIG